MTTWTEAQIDRHLHLWEHRHGPDSPEAGIVRQLRAERDAAWDALARIEDMTQHNMGMSARDERCINREARAALPTTQENTP
jgi:hypothetical protein